MTTQTGPTTTVVSVTTIPERDKLIRSIYQQLTTEPQTTFTIHQDQVNRIQIYHNVGLNNKVLIRTYLVVVVPVLVNLSPLNSIQGVIDFKLDNTIETLEKLITQLRSMQGRRIVKGGNFGQTLEQLARILC